jgi:glucose/arabinose dehydrogenase
VTTRTVLLALAAAALLAGCGSSGRDAAAPTATPTAAATTGGGGGGGARPAAKRGVKLVRIGNFDEPLYVTAPPGDTRQVFVVEQGGRIVVVRGGKTLPQPFLDLSDKTEASGEQGLLSMAFAPDYAQSGHFYVDYTDNGGDSHIVEYTRATEDRADPGSARELIFQRQPQPNHNGGLLLFGPDNLLYIGFGDGGGGGDQHGAHGNAQNLDTLLGKILRIDPHPSGGQPYGIPSSNPFVNRSDARPEIYAYGLRNPWRFSFDRVTGDLTIADVGQDQYEEVDFMRRERAKGANFGWRVFEGRSRYTPGESAPGAVMPVIVRSHSDGWCSITGGVIVRDRALAGLYGRYVFGDYCRPQILSARLSTGAARDVSSTGLKVPQLTSFGEDARGRVYATSQAGPVYRLAPR